MGVGNVDSLLNGRLAVLPWSKASFTGEASGGLHSGLYLAGLPGAGSAPSAGVNGTAVLNGRSGTLAAPAAVTGKSCYLNAADMSADASIGGAILVDRLWENSGLSVTLTSSQPISPGAFPLPARDTNNSNFGVGVGVALEVVTATTQVGAVTATLTYTNSDGVTGRTGTASIPDTAVAGTWIPFDLQAGDYGVRAITAFQLAATLSAGAISLVMHRLLGRIIALPAANRGSGFGPADGGMPVADGCAPHFVYLLSGTSAGRSTGTVQFVQA